MNDKIQSFKLENFGILPNLEFAPSAGINLIIGENGTGKTMLLKALYAATRALEEYRRGDDIRSMVDILSEKLRWTFQVEKLGDLVTRGVQEPLSFQMTLGAPEAQKTMGFRFSQSTERKVGGVPALTEGRSANSVFLPAKEVLSLHSIILESREVNSAFGFDDTYYDLAKALRIPPRRGRNYDAFARSRKKLKDVIRGRVEFDEKKGKWIYKDQNNYSFAIGATSEGVKKISILDRLFANGYLDGNSVIFIDELETALHPEAICGLLEMLYALSGNMGIQFFISTHSYFVIKKLVLLAMEKPGFISCLSLQKDRKEPIISDLHDGMPDNAIIDTSIRLYEQEIEARL